jgi:hypothetical protein
MRGSISGRAVRLLTTRLRSSLTQATSSARPAEEIGGRQWLLAELVALIYIGTIAAIASATGAFYILFPELGALSYDTLTRPRGRWAGAPILLAITPPLTGVVGTLVTRSMPYGFFSVLITVSGAFAVIVALRSPIAPAISAGLLPLVLGVQSWWYPPGILFGSTLLALVSLPWKRYSLGVAPTAPSPNARDAHVADARSPRNTIRWIAAVLAFVTIALFFVKITDMRFVLFPPLVVIIYEMLRHPAGCTWAGGLVRLPIVCFLSAAGGLLFHNEIANAPLAAMLSMAWGIAVLRVFRLHVPPALAVALLPMVMTNPTVAYPVAVGIGAALAAAWFALVQSSVDFGTV